MSHRHKKRVLVLGGNGMLGHKVVKELAKDQTLVVAATVRNKPLYHCDNVNWIKLDINHETIHYNLFSEQYDEIINCIGLVKQRANINISDYYLINSLFPRRLRDSAPNSRIIHITTDCVFSGKKGPYSESAFADPVDDYGISKLLGEQANGAINLRTSIIGTELEGAKSGGLIEWVLSQPKGSAINGYTNHYWNGVSTITFAKIIHQIISSNFSKLGIYHIPDPNNGYSKYELVSLINQVFDCGLNIRKYNDIPFVNRTLQSGLSITPYHQVKHLIPSMIEQLKELKSNV